MARPSDLQAARQRMHEHLRAQAAERAHQSLGLQRAGNFPAHQAVAHPGANLQDPNGGAQRASAFPQQPMIPHPGANLQDPNGPMRGGSLIPPPAQPNLGFHHFQPGGIVNPGADVAALRQQLGQEGSGFPGGFQRGGDVLPPPGEGGLIHLGQGIFLHPGTGELHGFGPHGFMPLGQPGGGAVQPGPSGL